MNNLLIDALELTDRLNRQEALTIIDVREPIEYHTFNIGGVNLPLSTLHEHIDELDVNKATEIIVICKAGIRSRTAQRILQQLGYENVRNLTGGLLAIQKKLLQS